MIFNVHFDFFDFFFICNIADYSLEGVVVVICWLDLQLPVQSVPITTKVVSSKKEDRMVTTTNRTHKW